MQVRLIDYTGHGHADPARHAANVLVFTKNTRLNMTADLFQEIEARPWSHIEEELDYMAQTIPSSWEFVEYKFIITGVTRAFTHQFVRTRTGAYAQQTMRVLDVSGWDYLTGPSIKLNPLAQPIYDDAMLEIDEAYKALIDLDGVKIEDARGVLPTNILTNIAAKFDLRTMADMFRKRASSRTQGEYRDVISAMKAEVMSVHPWASKFFNRTFDVAAAELEERLIGLIEDVGTRTDLIKLIDQMRMTV